MLAVSPFMAYLSPFQLMPLCVEADMGFNLGVAGQPIWLDRWDDPRHLTTMTETYKLSRNFGRIEAAFIGLSVGGSLSVSWSKRDLMRDATPELLPGCYIGIL